MTHIQDSILQIPFRADRNDDAALTSTFVQVGALLPSLSSFNNSLLYGRRGTGKTHVLKYLKSSIEKKGDWGIFIDLRTIGSSNSLYSESSIPLPQRTLSLLSDVLKEIHDGILKHIMSNDENRTTYLGEAGPALSQFIQFVDEKRIKGDISKSENISSSVNNSIGLSLGIEDNNPYIGISAAEKSTSQYEKKESSSGVLETYMDFQTVYFHLNEVTKVISPHKLWILFDEFSNISSDLQVYLADMIRKVLSPNRRITFKIAAVKHRTHLINRLQGGGYIGIEDGSDVSSFDLDNYLVFGNNEAQSLFFFRNLLYNHINALLEDDKRLKDSSELITELFTQENAFVELVNAAEGVPRDAINILIRAISFDYDKKVSVPSIRKAARSWYQDDKQKNVIEYSGASELLNWIIENVIGERHAKAFLLRQGGANDLINYLYDYRILHIIKKGISSHDTPGIKYDAFSIDYGCYCDLINTAKEPQGLFQAIDDNEEIESFVTVPKDDYRSIRRAILDLNLYEKYRQSITTVNLK